MNPLVISRLVASFLSFKTRVDVLINASVSANLQLGQNSSSDLGKIIALVKEASDTIMQSPAYYNVQTSLQHDKRYMSMARRASHDLGHNIGQSDIASGLPSVSLFLLKQLQLVATMVSPYAADLMFRSLKQSEQDILNDYEYLWSTPNVMLLHKALTMYINNPSNRISLRRQMHYFCSYAQMCRLSEVRRLDARDNPEDDSILAGNEFFNWNRFLASLGDITLAYKDTAGLYRETQAQAKFELSLVDDALALVPNVDYLVALTNSDGDHRSRGSNGFYGPIELESYLAGLMGEYISVTDI